MGIVLVKKKKNPYQMLLHRYIIFHNAASNRLSACGADRPAAVITCLEAWLWSQSRTVLNKMKNWAPHGIKRQVSKIQSRSFEIQRPSSALFSASRASDSSGSGYKPQPVLGMCKVRSVLRSSWWKEGHLVLLYRRTMSGGKRTCLTDYFYFLGSTSLLSSLPSLLPSIRP